MDEELDDVADKVFKADLFGIGLNEDISDGSRRIY